MSKSKIRNTPVNKKNTKKLLQEDYSSQMPIFTPRYYKSEEDALNLVEDHLPVWREEYQYGVYPAMNVPGKPFLTNKITYDLNSSENILTFVEHHLKNSPIKRETIALNYYHVLNNAFDFIGLSSKNKLNFSYDTVLYGTYNKFMQLMVAVSLYGGSITHRTPSNYVYPINFRDDNASPEDELMNLENNYNYAPLPVEYFSSFISPGLSLIRENIAYELFMNVLITTDKEYNSRITYSSTNQTLVSTLSSYITLTLKEISDPYSFIGNKNNVEIIKMAFLEEMGKSDTIYEVFNTLYSNMINHHAIIDLTEYNNKVSENIDYAYDVSQYRDVVVHKDDHQYARYFTNLLMEEIYSSLCVPREIRESYLTSILEYLQNPKFKDTAYKRTVKNTHSLQDKYPDLIKIVHKGSLYKHVIELINDDETLLKEWDLLFLNFINTLLKYEQNKYDREFVEVTSAAMYYNLDMFYPTYIFHHALFERFDSVHEVMSFIEEITAFINSVYEVDLKTHKHHIDHAKAMTLIIHQTMFQALLPENKGVPLSWLFSLIVENDPIISVNFMW